MDTRDLLQEHRKLEKTDPTAALALFEANKGNELFVSLVQFRRELLPEIVRGFSKVVDDVLDS